MSLAVTIAQKLAATPPEIATIILAMLPVVELRGALPVALAVYKMSAIEAIFWAVVGNMLPVWFLLVFFERGSNWLRARSPYADRLFNKLFERTRRKLEVNVEKYGPWALALFVAVPLPVTGAWTGTLAAFVFGLPKKQAFGAIFIGVCIAAIIVTLLTLGATATARSLF